VLNGDEGRSTFGVGRTYWIRKNTTAVYIAIEAVIGDIGGEHDGTCDAVDDMNGAWADANSIGEEDISPDV